MVREYMKRINARGREIASRSVYTARDELSMFRSEVKKNALTAILAAFGLVMALVWKDAIQAGVNEIVARTGITGTGYIYQLATAAAVTIVCVLGIIIFSRMKGKEDIKA